MYVQGNGIVRVINTYVQMCKLCKVRFTNLHLGDVGKLLNAKRGGWVPQKKQKLSLHTSHYTLIFKNQNLPPSYLIKCAFRI